MRKQHNSTLECIKLGFQGFWGIVSQNLPGSQPSRNQVAGNTPIKYIPPQDLCSDRNNLSGTFYLMSWQDVGSQEGLQRWCLYDWFIKNLQMPMEGGCTGSEGGKGNQRPWPLLVWVHALDLGSPVCSEPREGPSPQQHTATFSCMDGSPKLEHRNWGTQHWVVMSNPLSRPLWPVVPCSSLEAPRPYTHMPRLLWQAPTGARVPGSLEWTEEGMVSGGEEACWCALCPLLFLTWQGFLDPCTPSLAGQMS